MPPPVRSLSANPPHDPFCRCSLAAQTGLRYLIACADIRRSLIVWDTPGKLERAAVTSLGLQAALAHGGGRFEKGPHVLAVHQEACAGPLGAQLEQRADGGAGLAAALHQELRHARQVGGGDDDL